MIDMEHSGNILQLMEDSLGQASQLITFCELLGHDFKLVVSCFHICVVLLPALCTERVLCRVVHELYCVCLGLTPTPTPTPIPIPIPTRWCGPGVHVRTVQEIAVFTAVNRVV
jgi:hypothetical protein